MAMEKIKDAETGDDLKLNAAAAQQAGKSWFWGPPTRDDHTARRWDQVTAEVSQASLEQGKADETLFAVLQTVLRTIKHRLEQSEPGDTAGLFRPPPIVGKRYYPPSVEAEHKEYFVREREAVAMEDMRTGQQAMLRKMHCASDDDLRYPFDRQSHRHRHLRGGKKRRNVAPRKWLSVLSSDKDELAAAEHAAKMAVRARKFAKQARKPLDWVRYNRLAAVQHRKRLEHLMSIVEAEQRKEMAREMRMLGTNISKKQRRRVAHDVAKERADTADFIMRIMQDYKLISGAEMATYLTGVIKSLHGEASVAASVPETVRTSSYMDSDARTPGDHGMAANVANDHTTVIPPRARKARLQGEEHDRRARSHVRESFGGVSEAPPPRPARLTPLHSHESEMTTPPAEQSSTVHSSRRREGARAHTAQQEGTVRLLTSVLECSTDSSPPNSSSVQLRPPHLFSTGDVGAPQPSRMLSGSALDWGWHQEGAFRPGTAPVDDPLSRPTSSSVHFSLASDNGDGIGTSDSALARDSRSAAAKRPSQRSSRVPTPDIQYKPSSRGGVGSATNSTSFDASRYGGDSQSVTQLSRTTISRGEGDARSHLRSRGASRAGGSRQGARPSTVNALQAEALRAVLRRERESSAPRPTEVSAQVADRGTTVGGSSRVPSRRSKSRGRLPSRCSSRGASSHGTRPQSKMGIADDSQRVPWNEMEAGPPPANALQWGGWGERMSFAAEQILDDKGDIAKKRPARHASNPSFGRRVDKMDPQTHQYSFLLARPVSDIEVQTGMAHIEARARREELEKKMLV